MHNALRSAKTDVSVKRLRNFCINKNKMVIIKEDRMQFSIKRMVTVQGSY